MSNEINHIASIEEAEAMIAQEEENKQAVYLEIGKQYYLRHSADCEPDFKPLVDELVASSGRIAEINRRILALKGPTCPECGASVSEDSIFCSGCGARLKEEPVVEEPAVSPDVVICSNCGSEMKKNMRFCTACGTPIIAQEPDPDVPPTREYAPMDQGTAVPVAEDIADIPILDPVADRIPVIDSVSAVEQIPVYDPQPAVENKPAPEQDLGFTPEPVAQKPINEAPQPPVVSRSYAAPEPANICPACGAVSDAGVRFCVNCGNPLMAQTAPASGHDNGVRRCSNCGFISTDPNMPFCTECGTLLN